MRWRGPGTGHGGGSAHRRQAREARLPRSLAGHDPGLDRHDQARGTRRPAEGPALLLLAAPIPAAQALDWGLVTAIADDEPDLNAQIDGWLDRLLANGPSALALIKGLLGTLHQDLRHHHAAAAAQAAGTEDCREGVRAFIEKRPPVYRGR